MRGTGKGRGKGAYYPTAKKAPRNQVGKAPRKTPRKSATPKRSKALVEIRKQQQTTDLCIPKAPFKRLIKELMAQNCSSVEFISAEAVEALQAVSEAMITGFFADVNMVAIHANRETIMDKDVALVKKLRSDTFGAEHGGRAGDITALGK